MNIFTNIIVVVCMLVSGVHIYRHGEPIIELLLGIFCIAKEVGKCDFGGNSGFAFD